MCTEVSAADRKLGQFISAPAARTGAVASDAMPDALEATEVLDVDVELLDRMRAPSGAQAEAGRGRACGSGRANAASG